MKVGILIPNPYPFQQPNYFLSNHEVTQLHQRAVMLMESEDEAVVVKMKQNVTVVDSKYDPVLLSKTCPMEADDEPLDAIVLNKYESMSEDVIDLAFKQEPK